MVALLANDAFEVQFPPYNDYQIRGGSRNVEGGVLVLCRAVESNFVLVLALQKAVHRGA